MDIRFEGKTAVVTGAGRGLGRCIAKTLALSGAEVAVCDVQEAAAESAAAEIRDAGHKARAYRMDVAESEEIETVMASVPRIDIVVNAAGITLPQDLLKADPVKAEKLFKVNVIGSANILRCAIEHMRPQRSGKIVLVASVAGKQAGSNLSHYRASKSAVISLAMSGAMVAAPYNINVNAVCPGIIRTQMWEDILDAMAEESGQDREEIWNSIVSRKIPLGRAQTEESIAKMTAVLCSELADDITGQAVSVDGGQVMSF